MEVVLSAEHAVHEIANIRMRHCEALLSIVRFADLLAILHLIPAMNRWAISVRPLRGLLAALSILSQINCARISIASSTSSSVLKKCGDMRSPTPGRESTKTLRSASRLTIAGPSST